MVRCFSCYSSLLVFDDFRWGIGVDLYFSSLRIMSIILLIAGLINIPNILFYASDDYSDGSQMDLPSFSLIGSAVCTTRDWVVCINCTESSYTTDLEKEWFGRPQNGQSDTVLVQRNGCNAGDFMRRGMVNYATMVFLGVVMAVVGLYLKAREVRFDEDK